jgi:hypothetical protein
VEGTRPDEVSPVALEGKAGGAHALYERDLPLQAVELVSGDTPSTIRRECQRTLRPRVFIREA